MKHQRDTEGEEESDREKGPGEIQKEVTRVLRRWKEGAGRDVSWSIRGEWRAGARGGGSSLAGMGQGEKLGDTERSS